LIMDSSALVAGTPVKCRDSRLGVLVSMQGEGQSRLLVVRPTDEAAGTALLHVPVTYVASTDDEGIVLRLSCDEVRQVAGGYSLQGSQADDVLRVPVVEEILTPLKQWTEAGALEITKTVRTEVQELDVPVQYEQASVQRVAVGRVLHDDEFPTSRQEGDTLIVPVVHEELIVVKRRVLVEELRVTKQVQTRTQRVSEEVQREEVNVSHTGLEEHAAQS